MTDEIDRLILAARGGDREAFGRLYSRYARMVHGIAMAHLRRQDADDVVQEAFVRGIEQIHALRDVRAFGGWLAAIARHLTMDVLRRGHERPETVDEPAAPDNPHDALEAQRALDAIRELPEAYRETIMLRLVEGMTGPEIAERTGLTPASVRVNLHRGMKLLRARLEIAVSGNAS